MILTRNEAGTRTRVRKKRSTTSDDERRGVASERKRGKGDSFGARKRRWKAVAERVEEIRGAPARASSLMAAARPPPARVERGGRGEQRGRRAPETARETAFSPLFSFCSSLSPRFSSFTSSSQPRAHTQATRGSPTTAPPTTRTTLPCSAPTRRSTTSAGPPTGGSTLPS